MHRGTTFLWGVVGAALLAGTGGSALQAADITITMAAPDWPPTRFMKEEFDKTYQSPDGHNTTLEMDFIPWPSFYERVAASLTSGEQKYQMVVSDSQWLGAFVEGVDVLQGHTHEHALDDALTPGGAVEVRGVRAEGGGHQPGQRAHVVRGAAVRRDVERPAEAEAGRLALGGARDGTQRIEHGEKALAGHAGYAGHAIGGQGIDNQLAAGSLRHCVHFSIREAEKRSMPLPLLLLQNALLIAALDDFDNHQRAEHARP